MTVYFAIKSKFGSAFTIVIKGSFPFAVDSVIIIKGRTVIGGGVGSFADMWI